MSETTKRDLNALREGLRLVEEWRKTHEDRARMARVEATAEMERRQAGAYAAVAAVVRRELEAPAAGEQLRERVAREVFALDDDSRREYWDQFVRDFPRQAQVYYDTADRILALVRTPRGEGEDCRLAPIVRAILERIDRYQAFHDRVGPADLTLPPVARTITEEEILALRAALRSEAQGEARPRTSWGWMDYLECLLEDHVGAHDPATCCDVDDDEACCTTCALYRLHQRKPWRAAHSTDRNESDGE